MFMHASPGAAFYAYMRIQGGQDEVPEASEAPLFTPTLGLQAVHSERVRPKTRTSTGLPTQQAARGSLERPPAPLRATRCNRNQHSRSSDAAHCYSSGRRGGARRAWTDAG